MEYTLMAFYYIFQTLINTLMGLVIDEKKGVTVGTTIIACMILYAFFKGIGFIVTDHSVHDNYRGNKNG